MQQLLNTLRRRLLGVANPYAGYVEACVDTVNHWGIANRPAYALRNSYTDYAFTARVEKIRGER